MNLPEDYYYKNEQGQYWSRRLIMDMEYHELRMKNAKEYHKARMKALKSQDSGKVEGQK